MEQRGKKGRRTADSADATAPPRTLEERAAKQARKGTRRARDDDGDGGDNDGGGDGGEGDGGGSRRARADLPEEHSMYVQAVAKREGKKQAKAQAAQEAVDSLTQSRNAMADEAGGAKREVRVQSALSGDLWGFVGRGRSAFW